MNLRAPLRSPCCDARVVALVDVTVHPRLYRNPNGALVVGQIVDSLAAIRADAADSQPDIGGAYCRACGRAVDARALAAQDPPNGGGADTGTRRS